MSIGSNIYIISRWWFGTFLFFHSVGNAIIPNDFHMFQRGRYTTNQIYIGLSIFHMMCFWRNTYQPSAAHLSVVIFFPDDLGVMPAMDPKKHDMAFRTSLDVPKKMMKFGMAGWIIEEVMCIADLSVGLHIPLLTTYLNLPLKLFDVFSRCAVWFVT